jgi:hypothetical protein
LGGIPAPSFAAHASSVFITVSSTRIGNKTGLPALSLLVECFRHLILYPIVVSTKPAPT